AGSSFQWAMGFNEALGHFFDAPHMVPIASAHFAPDTRMMGDAGKKLLQRLVDDQVKVCVPSTLDPCSVDFGRAAEFIAEFGMSEAFVEQDRSVYRLCSAMGFLPTYSCINYQTVSSPQFGQHVAWGDTGAAISANSIFGARTNFDGGPSALASAITGYTPAYGFHLDNNRRGNLLIKIDCQPTEIADWGAIARWAGQIATGYETVPVFHGDFAPPDQNMLKQLGVALASYGSHAMFHVVGATPEAPTLEAACGGTIPDDEHVIARHDLDVMFEDAAFGQASVDLVVFAAPQLSVDEIALIATRMNGRRVHDNTRMILAIDPQVKAEADKSGLSTTFNQLGADLSTGTCFYPEAPLLRDKTGWRTVVTNSAKLVNTLASAGYETAFRRLDACLDAAVTGRLDV
ncbi:MAG: DUF521 domain-containing protein, partial [Rhodospirillales bacterium]|nr:DUF521 domain-containing protein [Rhodospirillales bacterium]